MVEPILVPIEPHFIIDEEGKVEHIITPKSIKVKEHASQLLKLVK